MGKEKHIEHLRTVIETYDKQISTLLDAQYEAQKKLNLLYAPEIPKEMLGKYLKQTVGDFNEKYVYVEHITSDGDADDENMCFLRYCGFGWFKNKKGQIHISNREIISTLGESSKSIQEISEEEFNNELKKVFVEVQKGIDWKDEF